MSVVVSVSPAGTLQQLDSQWTDFCEIWSFILSLSKICFIKILQKTDSLHEDLCKFDIARWIVLKMKKNFQTKVVEKKTPFMLSNFFQNIVPFIRCEKCGRDMSQMARIQGNYGKYTHS